MRYAGERAYVLHARAWRETSLLVEVLSEHQGRVGLVARGVHGNRRQQLRAALQPMQHIRFDAVQRGELGQLNAAEALDVAPMLVGEAMLSGFYVNELLMRLAPRQDPHPELYALYGEVRSRLGRHEAVAWTLRRFERDLLEMLGFGFDLSMDGEGHELDPAARYRLDPEHGPRRVREQRSGQVPGATGRGLLALAGDVQPEAEDMAGLRHAMRSVLSHHLGARGLKSWELVGDLSRLSARTRRDQDDSMS